MKQHIGQEERLRLEKLEQIKKIGIDPYPAASFFANTTVKKIKEGYAEDKEKSEEVIIAGRLMAKRIIGAVSFAELQDHTGRVQLYLKRDILCQEEDKTLYNTLFKKLLDLGDIIGVEGSTFTTKVGDLAIKVTRLILLAKTLKPLPAPKEVIENGKKTSYYTFSNPEQRYRQRYLDLIFNPEKREIFEKRAQIIRSLRRQLDKENYLEVETPILQPIYGGASARPFVTHHNTLNMPLYLRIANELYLKRLMVGGYRGVYEFAKDFRNEGMSRHHNPEFTQLEFYVAYRDHIWMMKTIEKMIKQVVFDIHKKTTIPVGDHSIDFAAPWRQYTLYEAINKFTGIDAENLETQALIDFTRKNKIDTPERANRGQVLDLIFSKFCEPNLIEPTFITNHPVEMSPLAKQYRENPQQVQRFEVICHGKELCNAFSELNDPLEQRKRFEAQQKLAKEGDQEAMCLDEDYISALSFGLPPTAGIGLGIDRFTMLLTNQPSIQEVIFFPQMKKEKVFQKNDEAPNMVE